MDALLFYSLIGGFFSLIGGVILLWKPKFTKEYMTPLLGFGAGAFLAGAFLDILPEAIEMVVDPKPVLIAVLVGFLGFFILERFLMRSFHMHSIESGHSEHIESLPYLLALGDAFHNFLDGILIGLASSISPSLGLPTALAVAAHEIPQEMGDFAVMIRQGWSKPVVLGINIAQSLLTIPGVYIGFYMQSIIGGYVPTLLGLAAGIFIYIAATDIIPELHHNSSHKHFFRVVIPTILGVVLVSYFSALEH